MLRSRFIISLSVLVVMTMALSAQATTISYPNFSDLSDLQLLNCAAPPREQDGVVLNLSPERVRFIDNGVAWYRYRVPLAPDYSFATTFQFVLYGAGDWRGADGFTFTMHTSPNGINAYGGGGGWLGYANDSQNAIVPSVAVEFDTVQNYPLATSLDPNNNHIGINCNSAFGVLGTPVTNGNLPFDLNYPEGTAEIHQAWIEYDGTTMRVWLGDPGTRPETPLLTHTFDLGAILGTNQVYVGFTAGYASYFQYHEIVSWEFTSVPAPSTLLLLGTGLMSL